MPYQRQMLGEALEACHHRQSVAGNLRYRILVLGLGGGAMPMQLRRHCESAFVESVEVDPVVVGIAERLMGFRTDSHSKIEVYDALLAVQRRAQALWALPEEERYRLILVDCFDGNGDVPASCNSKEFVSALRALMAPGGMVLQNVLMKDSSLLSIYQDHFGVKHAKTSMVRGSGTGQALITAYAN